MVPLLAPATAESSGLVGLEEKKPAIPEYADVELSGATTCLASTDLCGLVSKMGAEILEIAARAVQLNAE